MIAQTPNVDGPASLRTAAKHQAQLAMLRFTGRAVLDALGGMVGRPPRLVPLVGRPGTVAMLATPDALSGAERALDPGDRHADWQRTVAAANQAPHGDLVRMPGGHYAPFLDGHGRAVEAQLSFLRRNALNDARGGVAPSDAPG